jgi:pimeloyl-ACP methyl ester carboxylesterase
MAALGELSVRVRVVGGAVADEVTARPADWIQGRRHVVLFVHGFNNAEEAARTSYGGVFTTVLADVGYFYWPGDTRAGFILSAPTYPLQITSALDSARRLADYLKGVVGPGGSPSAVSFVGHSLGCRLILEAMRLALNDGLSWPEVRVTALMAAAVPVDLVEEGQPLDAAARSARTLALFYSRADQVLNLSFPPGQAAAFAFGIEKAAYGVAVGRFGQPVGLPAERVDTGLGHSEYWPSEDTADRVARMLGAATPRSLPDRTLASAGSPLSRELPVRDVLG